MYPEIASSDRKVRPSTWSRILAIREVGSLAALVIMLLVLTIAIPQFGQWGNIVNITRNFSFVGIVALGMTLVILTGEIDLSVGSVWGMTAVLTASLSIARSLALIITHHHLGTLRRDCRHRAGQLLVERNCQPCNRPGTQRDCCDRHRRRRD